MERCSRRRRLAGLIGRFSGVSGFLGGAYSLTELTASGESYSQMVEFHTADSLATPAQVLVPQVVEMVRRFVCEPTEAPDVRSGGDHVANALALDSSGRIVAAGYSTSNRN
jgi:hypothetical protein